MNKSKEGTIGLVVAMALTLGLAGADPALKGTLKPDFCDVRAFTAGGTVDIDKNDVVLTVRDDALNVDPTNRQIYNLDIEYGDITYASYSFSKQPRWGLGIGLAVFICLPCLAFALLKKKQHWLAFDTDEGPTLFKLHKSNYAQVMSRLRQHGVDVEDITDKPDRVAENES